MDRPQASKEMADKQSDPLQHRTSEEDEEHIYFSYDPSGATAVIRGGSQTLDHKLDNGNGNRERSMPDVKDEGALLGVQGENICGMRRGSRRESTGSKGSMKSFGSLRNPFVEKLEFERRSKSQSRSDKVLEKPHAPMWMVRSIICCLVGFSMVCAIIETLRLPICIFQCFLIFLASLRWERNSIIATAPSRPARICCQFFLTLVPLALAASMAFLYEGNDVMREGSGVHTDAGSIDEASTLSSRDTANNSHLPGAMKLEGNGNPCDHDSELRALPQPRPSHSVGVFPVNNL